MIKEPPFPIKGRKQTSHNHTDPEKRRNRFGRMVYGHKTAGEICIMTSDQFADFKSYEPGRCGISSIKTRSKTTGGAAGGLSGL
jgi:hypothetical protein